MDAVVLGAVNKAISNTKPYPKIYSVISSTTPTANTLTTVLNVQNKSGKLDYVMIQSIIMNASIDLKITIDGVVWFYKGATNSSTSTALVRFLGVGEMGKDFIITSTPSFAFLGRNPAGGNTDALALYSVSNNCVYVEQQVVDGSRSNTWQNHDLIALLHEGITFNSSIKIEFLNTTATSTGIYVRYRTV
jgi:hypothetical protein